MGRLEKSDGRLLLFGQSCLPSRRSCSPLMRLFFELGFVAAERDHAAAGLDQSQRPNKSAIDLIHIK